MEQREFSKLILKFLEGNYPQFAQTIKFQDDGSFDCDLKSESGIFSIWIATYNTEITIGIEDPNGKTDIHSHIPCYVIDDLEACVSELSSFIENIKADNLVLYQDEDGKYDWIVLNGQEGKDYKIGTQKGLKGLDRQNFVRRQMEKRAVEGENRIRALFGLPDSKTYKGEKIN